MPVELSELLDYEHGWYWPKATGTLLQRRKEIRRRPARLDNGRDYVSRLLSFVPPPKRRVVVQAGGHVGIWPKHLSPFFSEVYTFEPEWLNWLCLSRNIVERNVYPARAVLGCTHRGVDLARDLPFSGLSYVKPDSVGPVPTVRVDDLALRECDALLLDVEGFELQALLGADRTIRTHKPVVLVETLTHGERRGYGSRDEIEGFMVTRGYRPGRKFPVQADTLYVPLEVAGE